MGRGLVRELWARGLGPGLRLVAEADPAGRGAEALAADYAYLLAFDTAAGRFGARVGAEGGALLLDGMRVGLDVSGRPGAVDWAGAGVEVLIEASGVPAVAEAAAGLAPERVRRVLITRSAACCEVTLVRGVNLDAFDRGRHRVISCSTCTANAVAPVLMLLQGAYGVERANLTTVHPALSGDTMLDAPAPEAAAGRSGLSVRPLESQVARTTAMVLPELEGRLAAMSLRVPTLTVNALMADVVLERPPAGEAAVADLLAEAAAGELKEVLALDAGFAGRPKVAADFALDPHSAIVDLNWLCLNGKLLRLLIWHDNEYAYCRRVVDVLQHVVG